MVKNSCSANFITRIHEVSRATGDASARIPRERLKESRRNATERLTSAFLQTSNDDAVNGGECLREFRPDYTEKEFDRAGKRHHKCIL